ncbi:MAG: osmoprotectant transport system substrate-binding protein opuBD [Thermoleophilaceae bacterium]|nr:osmoprotectant transport system substrate-binding protein opuBD [Thermoleophilaceae bacterium]
MKDFVDAIEFIFESRETNEGVSVGGSQFLELAGDHMWLSLVSVAIACAVAIPVGLWLGHIGRGGFVAINASNVGRAVPSLALIAFFVAYLGVGFANVTLALVLMAIPPILTNTYVGVRQVDRDTVDAARGMGMTGAQSVRRVELPLALPLIFGGIRTSAVNVVATATLAPLAGLQSLGDPIINVSTYGDDGRLGAAIFVAFLAVATELSLAAIQRAATPAGLRPRRRPMKQLRYATAMIAVLLSALALAACGDDDDGEGGGGDGSTAGQIQRNDANSGTTITVGSKNFTEQKVLGEIYAQGLEAAGFSVEKELNLGDEKIALKALKGGQIDAYPEYTGTALLSFFGVAANEIPKDPAAAFEDAKAGFEADGLVAQEPTPFTSSNEVALTKERAEELGVTKISDLSDKAQDLTLYGSPECRQRTDCLLGLQEVYGLDFKKFVPVAIDLRHEVLTSGKADLSIVFTTDPQIQREEFVLLEDDKGMFPPYNSTLVMRQELADEAAPALEEVVTQVQEGLTDEVMQELNARVDLDKKTPAEVAAEYLKESGLV